VPKQAFNLKRDAQHMAFKGAFDVERHVQLWRLAPKRKENVTYIIQLLEEIFTNATVDKKVVVALLDNDRKKGARLKRGQDDVLRQVRHVKETYTYLWKRPIHICDRDLSIFVKETYTYLNDRRKGARLKRGQKMMSFVRYATYMSKRPIHACERDLYVFERPQKGRAPQTRPRGCPSSGTAT